MTLCIKGAYDSLWGKIGKYRVFLLKTVDFSTFSTGFSTTLLGKSIA
jgi:hypothetical protein